MSIEYLQDGWLRFGSGRRWRCRGPGYLCEIDNPEYAPSFTNMNFVVAKMRRIKSFYQGRLALAQLDENGTGIDVLAANAMTESYGTVPSPLSFEELRKVLAGAPGIDPGAKMDEVIRYISLNAKYLERREPGYGNPLDTPRRVSVGAHHVLLSTALSLKGFPPESSYEAKVAELTDLVCRVPSLSMFAAELAVRYFNRSYSRHLNQPPLLAATYNAGSPHPDSSNAWNLRQYGQHIDRWVSYYNTSRLVG